MVMSGGGLTMARGHFFINIHVGHGRDLNAKTGGASRSSDSAWSDGAVICGVSGRGGIDVAKVGSVCGRKSGTRGISCLH